MTVAVRLRSKQLAIWQSSSSALTSTRVRPWRAGLFSCQPRLSVGAISILCPDPPYTALSPRPPPHSYLISSFQSLVDHGGPRVLAALAVFALCFASAPGPSAWPWLVLLTGLAIEWELRRRLARVLAESAALPGGHRILILKVSGTG